MQYIHVELSGFKLLKFAGIKTISLDSSGIIQVIIGTNGSGKSSLLEEITPYPAVSSRYDDDGYKKIRIQYDGSLYELSSDFKSSKSPHSFIKDGVELNESGTTMIQEDLVETHLGYTKSIHAIVAMKPKLSQMTASQRHNWLTPLNPYKIQFISDHHKKVLSDIRVCKNNLTMLYERKAQLASQLLSNDDVDRMALEKVELVKTLDDINRIRYLVSKEQQDVNDNKKVYIEGVVVKGSDYYYNGKKVVFFEKDLLSIHRKLPSWLDVNKNEDDRSKINDKLIEKRTTRASLEVTLKDLSQEITAHEQYLSLIGTDEKTGELSSERAAILGHLSELEEYLIDNPLDKTLIDTKDHVMLELNTLLEAFTTFDGDLPSKQKFNRVNLWYNKGLQYITQLNFRIDQIDQRIAEINKGVKSFPSHIPVNQCEGYRCPLYEQFKQSDKLVKDELNRLGSSRTLLDRKLNTLSRYVEKRGSYLKTISFYMNQLDRLREFFSHYPYLYNNTWPVLMLLKSNPKALSDKVSNIFECSVKTYEYRDYKEKLQTLEHEISSIASVDKNKREMILDLKERSVLKHRDFLKQLMSIDDDILQLERMYKLTADYYTELDNIKNLEIINMCNLDKNIRVFDKKSLLEISETINNKYNEVLTRLGTIEKTLRDQDVIRSRYEDEILASIDAIELKKKKLTLIEKALAPNGIPQVYTVGFLNNVIRYVNYFIEKVFSYDLRLDELDSQNEIDYVFSAKADTTVIPDVSKGSSAQQEIFDVCFNLALIKVIGIQYPVKFDEIGKTFDNHHSQKVLDLLRYLVDNKIIPQLFIINHNTIIHQGLPNAKILVLNGNNIVLPDVYNDHVKIKK